MQNKTKKKPLITLVFKLKSSVVFCTKFDTLIWWGHLILISFYLSCHKNLDLDQQNVHQYIEQVFT